MQNTTLVVVCIFSFYGVGIIRISELMGLLACSPVIASGLIEIKQEITAALSKGAVAISTGTKVFWYV